jgi:hypothetical protein
VGVVEAVTAEIAGLPDELGDSGLAALVLACAENVDAAKPGTTPGAMWAQRLQEALRELRALAPPSQRADSVDEVKQQRERRRAEAKDRGRSAGDDVGG